MNQKESSKTTIHGIKSLRESVYQKIGHTLPPNVITVVPDDGEEKAKTYTSRLIIAVKKIDA